MIIAREDDEARRQDERWTSVLPRIGVESHGAVWAALVPVVPSGVELQDVVHDTDRAKALVFGAPMPGMAGPFVGEELEALGFAVPASNVAPSLYLNTESFLEDARRANAPAFLVRDQKPPAETAIASEAKRRPRK